MVKVGIIGAETPLAGEVIRIFINHPETELVSLYSPALMGRSISSMHHGLIGENSFFFTDKLNIGDLDFLIMLKFNEIAQEVLDKTSDMEEIKIVILDENLPLNFNLENFEIGLSEINRKSLVRGATRAVIPSPIIVPSLISLTPLASFLLLNSDIDIEVTLPSDLAIRFNEHIEAEKLEAYLKTKQASFNGKINLRIISDHNNERVSSTKIKFDSNLPIEEIEKIYDQIYDDHNFTFTTRNDISSKEVEGTHKVVVNIKKPNAETLMIESINDARMRGGAGDLVHIMNLFFGLHEKTGLHLKPSRF